MTLKIRSVTDEDCRLLWEWVNDPEVRKSALRSDPIPWEEHVAWFHGTKVDLNSYIYILTDQDDCPVGQVRFDTQPGGRAEVDISIARDQRGRGYGVEGLQLACERLLSATGVKHLVAYIKPENVASIRAFEKAGFSHQGREYVKGHEAVCMTLKRQQT